MDGVRATRKIHSKLNGQRDRGRERGAFGSDWEQEQLTEAEGIRITHQDSNKEGQLTHRQNEEAADARAAGSPLHRTARGRRIQRREIEREKRKGRDEGDMQSFCCLVDDGLEER